MAHVSCRASDMGGLTLNKSNPHKQIEPNDNKLAYPDAGAYGYSKDREGGYNSHREDRYSRANERYSERTRPMMTCYTCGGEGHKSFQCDSARSGEDTQQHQYRPAGGYETNYSLQDSRSGYQPPRERRDSYGSIKCFNCHGEGHKSSGCPELRSDSDSYGYSRSYRSGGGGGGGSYRRSSRDDSGGLDSQLDSLQLNDPNRPKLHLAPRSQQSNSNTIGAPAAVAQEATLAEVYAKKPNTNPFGEAKPREVRKRHTHMRQQV